MDGKGRVLTQVFSYIEPTSSKKYLFLKNAIDRMAHDKGVFLYLSLLDENKNLLDDNLYWLPDSTGNYSGLQEMKKATVEVTAHKIKEGKIEVTISNEKENPIAFFNRISLINSQTKQRLLPAFYSDNYISVLPGENKKIEIDYTPAANENAAVEVKGWNVTESVIEIK